MATSPPSRPCIAVNKIFITGHIYILVSRNSLVVLRKASTPMSIKGNTRGTEIELKPNLRKRILGLFYLLESLGSIWTTQGLDGETHAYITYSRKCSA